MTSIRPLTFAALACGICALSLSACKSSKVATIDTAIPAYEEAMVVPAQPEPEMVMRTGSSAEESMADVSLYQAYIPSSAMPKSATTYPAGAQGERYNTVNESNFVEVSAQPLSTFSIDVDTGAYSNVRRFLTEYRQLPPTEAVRIEELINYFDYAYPASTYGAGADPFSAQVAVASCPWAEGHKLVRVGVQGAVMPKADRSASNLVFLVDVSGSMASEDKLPLVKQGLKMLVGQLEESDQVGIVIYAGSSGVVLESTPGSEKRSILDAIEALESGGSTNGGSGIQLAYGLARKHFIKGGVNRVILATDGDFNVGVTSHDALIEMVQAEAQSDIFLTVLGFGTGNLNDAMMEQVSNKGNGMYAYIDSLREARKVLVEQLQGSLVTIAKDVKIQVEFNPARVRSYRLIGYENRALAAEDFNDDKKDAGEIGAGHSVTALYEVVPAGEGGSVDPLRYQASPEPAHEASPFANELMLLKLRYKQPEGDDSRLLQFPINDSNQAFAEADEDFRFAASVAAWGMLLSKSTHSGSATFDTVLSWAGDALGSDTQGYRTEFLDLLRKSKEFSPDQ